MQPDTLSCSTGQYALLRPGTTKKQSLRAWDAADEYLISLIYDQYPLEKLSLFNDQFGALGITLNNQTDCWVNDSFCAQQSLFKNSQHNNVNLNFAEVTPLSTWPTKATLGAMKLPKNLSYLHFLLEKCQRTNISTLLIAGMMKHLPKNILSFLQQFGSVKRYPFKKKATVYELKLQEVPTCPYPKQNQFAGIHLVSHANVYGKDKLDPGADFFLQHLSKLDKAQNVADLCCGSGILGLNYAKSNPMSHIDFFDESHMAVQSTLASWQENNFPSQANFYWDDGLSQLKDKKYNLILCNPPFHEHHTVGDHIAKRLFKDAKEHLNPNGQLVVVGNRHLGYHVTLKKYFNKIEQISDNHKFVLLSARV